MLTTTLSNSDSKETKRKWIVKLFSGYCHHLIDHHHWASSEWARMYRMAPFSSDSSPKLDCLHFFISLISSQDPFPGHKTKHTDIREWVKLAPSTSREKKLFEPNSIIQRIFLIDSIITFMLEISFTCRMVTKSSIWKQLWPSSQTRAWDKDSRWIERTKQHENILSFPKRQWLELQEFSHHKYCSHLQHYHGSNLFLELRQNNEEIEFTCHHFLIAASLISSSFVAPKTSSNSYSNIIFIVTFLK